MKTDVAKKQQNCKSECEFNFHGAPHNGTARQESTSFGRNQQVKLWSAQALKQAPYQRPSKRRS